MLKNRPLCIFHPKMGRYKRNFYKTRFISFSIKYKRYLEKCNEI